MKKIIFCLALLISVLAVHSVEAKTIKVKSYYKPSTGKFIDSHYKTSPNKIKIDNYSSKGNYNPFTGKKGYKNF